MHIVFKVNSKDTRRSFIDVRFHLYYISTAFTIYMEHVFVKWFRHGLLKTYGAILRVSRGKIVDQVTNYGFCVKAAL